MRRSRKCPRRTTNGNLHYRHNMIRIRDYLYKCSKSGPLELTCPAIRADRLTGEPVQSDYRRSRGPAVTPGRNGAGRTGIADAGGKSASVIRSRPCEGASVDGEGMLTVEKALKFFLRDLPLFDLDATYLQLVPGSIHFHLPPHAVFHQSKEIIR